VSPYVAVVGLPSWQPVESDKTLALRLGCSVLTTNFSEGLHFPSGPLGTQRHETTAAVAHWATTASFVIVVVGLSALLSIKGMYTSVRTICPNWMYTLVRVVLYRPKVGLLI